ncbi:MAG TPA: beta-galactosidase [Candidatus Eisenbergiella intestinigallinarum]|uniref:Beta-galactosidase n=1 Tax=Candidatus Eisenbergiella intestinigallinarum TaxID=2838549 RepID=A0A9D2TSI0_9FIRM|nr:beta-galactosidase [Candidatus Eisenbergiella intestinigallinarum]
MTANIPRPEHPFPQMVRENWMNLNGTWDFEFDFGVSGLEQGYERRTDFKDKIIVPFCPESVLSGIGYTDFIPAVWYHRTFSLTEEKLRGRVLIHFGAVDYDCRVFVNGKEAGRHKGGYVSFVFDITGLVQAGENDLTVYAQDDTRSPMQPIGKQSDRYASYACSYTRTTGIWQTVWLEFTPVSYVKAVQYYPNISEGTLTIKAQVEGEGVLTASASYEGKDCGSAAAASTCGNVFLTLPLKELHLWEPGAGRLYDLTLTFGEDHVNSYFGMREVKLDGYRFLINGKSVFQRLVLDQGFYPDGIYTAPSDEALQNDIRLSMAAGFNGARLHQKVFEPRFLYHCDRMGYLTWGEMANWGFDISSYTGYEAFIPEWMQAIERDFNHPSIIGWCPFNETWDYEGRRQIDGLLALTYHLTKQYDTTRPCIDTSGNFHVITDIYDVHDYEQDPAVFAASYEPFKNGTGPFRDAHSARQQYTEGLPMFVSEYGGIKWAMDASDEKAWGYGNGPKTEEEFVARYKGLTEALLSNPKMFGFCYTQLTDVEQEQNGIYTYDRKEKVDVKLFHDINVQKAAIED